MKNTVLEVILVQPRGFCAGVKRAINIAELVLKNYSTRYKIYVLHEIVHNRSIIEYFKKLGINFIEKLSDVCDQSILIFSAHGVTKEVERVSKEKNIYVIDATCPLVSKVHRETEKNDAKGFQTILIGHKNHPEVIGIIGRTDNSVLLLEKATDIPNLIIKDPNKLAYVTQTTLSVDETKEIISSLKKRFTNIIGPDLQDICYATQNRQNAIKSLPKDVEILFIIGSKNSSNSNRLLELGKSQGIKSFLIDSYKDIDLNIIEESKKIAITAGASAPEILVEELINHLSKHVNIKISLLKGAKETVEFKLPKKLFHIENNLFDRKTFNRDLQHEHGNEISPDRR